MNYEISQGVVKSAQKVVIYGPEGIGKSTFASHFPDPLFIDTEGSTKKLNVKRYPKPTSWEMLCSEVRETMNTKPCKTLVIDTIDWAEQLCIKAICDLHAKTGIEDFGYGKGYVFEREEFGKFLNLLQDAVDSGLNVVLTAHAKITKFELPEEMGAYDRWELKLGQKTGSQISPLVKEWADTVLFANYKIQTISVDKDGKKKKAQGGQRVMYTTHNPCYDAKNRDGLAPELPFDFSTIAHIFSDDIQLSQMTSQATAPVIAPQPLVQATTQTIQASQEQQVENTQGKRRPLPREKLIETIPKNIPEKLKKLMLDNCISEEDIRWAVGTRGYYPEDTPIENYSLDFIEGCLIGGWDTLFRMINDSYELPF